MYTQTQREIKKIALNLLKKEKLSHREMTWFFSKTDKYKDTDDIWVTQKID